jgi:hypothetical protein
MYISKSLFYHFQIGNQVRWPQHIHDSQGQKKQTWKNNKLCLRKMSGFQDCLLFGIAVFVHIEEKILLYMY